MIRYILRDLDFSGGRTKMDLCLHSQPHMNHKNVFLIIQGDSLAFMKRGI